MLKSMRIIFSIFLCLIARAQGLDDQSPSPKPSLIRKKSFDSHVKAHPSNMRKA